MARFLRFLLVLGLTLGVILPHSLVGSANEGLPPIMRLSEIKPGMRGIGRTTVKGQTIEEFQFEVIGLLQGGGGVIAVKQLILFRVFGPLAERIGGTAAGMSGSPMFINGKLIGAHSASYRFQTRKDLGLATPIEEMLPLLDQAAAPPWPTAYRPTAPLLIDGQPVQQVVVARSPEVARRLTALGPGTLVFTAANTMNRVSGLSPRAFGILERVLGRVSSRPLVQYGGSQAAVATATIRGGHPVGILLVRGDVEFGGICTVTLRVGNKLLICGHPWDNLGEVAYALTSAEILTVVQTLATPFLEGNLGGLVGQIDQDRGTGIRGVLGRMPRMFAVRVTVADADTGKRVTKTMQVVRRADLVGLFTPLFALTAVDRARDQVSGGGTARVKITLRAGGLPEVIVRENIFYSSLDLTLASILDISTAMQFLFSNPFVALDPSDLAIEITVSRKRETAVITNVVAETREVNPGESIRVRITVRPFQEEAVLSRVIEIPVPRNFPRGPAVLIVGSGGIDTTGAQLDELFLRNLLAEPPPFPGDTLEEAVEIFETLGRNDQVLLQLVPFGLPATGAEFLKFDVFAGTLIQTHWVIQGEFRIPILVK